MWFGEQAKNLLGGAQLFHSCLELFINDLNVEFFTVGGQYSDIFFAQQDLPDLVPGIFQ